MRSLFPVVLIAVLMCFTSCSTSPSDIDLSMNSDIKAFVKTLNREAQEEGAPFRYRITADGYFIEKYPSVDFDKVLEEVDTAPPSPSLANDSLMLGIYEKISDYEVQNGGQAYPDIVETRILKKRNGYYREAWIIVSNGSVKEYLVTYKLIQYGGTDGTIYPL
jgi:hypothetical protein